MPNESSESKGAEVILTKKVKTPTQETAGTDGGVVSPRADAQSPPAHAMVTRAHASDDADDADERMDMLVALSEPKSVTEERFEQAEEMLATGMSPRKVARAMATEHGVTKIHARRWVRNTFERWANEAPTEERLARKKHLREAAWHGVQLAFARRNMSLDAMGGEHFYAYPDTGAARGLLEFLARLDGVLELETAPIQVNVTIEQRVAAATEALRAHYGLGAPALQPGEAQVIEAPAEAQKAGNDGKQ
jgi:hypothetical protein